MLYALNKYSTRGDVHANTVVRGSFRPILHPHNHLRTVVRSGKCRTREQDRSDCEDGRNITGKEFNIEIDFEMLLTFAAETQLLTSIEPIGFPSSEAIYI